MKQGKFRDIQITGFDYVPEEESEEESGLKQDFKMLLYKIPEGLSLKEKIELL